MSNWSTPNAHDGRRPGSDATSTQGRNLKREAEDFLAHAELSNGGGGNLVATPNHTGGQDLEGAVEQWQTPGTDSFRSRGGDRKDEMGLDQQARMQDIWQTPNSRDADKWHYRTSDSDKQQNLSGQAAEIEHSFRPDQPIKTSGETSSPNAPTSPRRLNPKFVEWLQGLPEGWTSAAPINSENLATWFSRCREQLHSLCSSTE